MQRVERSARDHVAEITAALNDGDNEGAADQAGQGLALFPDAVAFHRLRGLALFALGANAEAKTHLDAALAVDPLDNETIIALARLADAEGDPYTAAEHLLTAWEHDPANTDLRAELTERLATLYGAEGYLQFTRPALAALYVRNLFPERAAREYRAILTDHPDRTDLRLAAALAQWRIGNLTETVAECTALLDAEPHLVRARWALADAVARLGTGERAREHAKQAATADPDGAIARALIASAPDAAIVDPDEPLYLPNERHGRASRLTLVPPLATPSAAEEEAMMPEPPEPLEPKAGTAGEAPPKSDTMRLIETLSGLTAALAEAKRSDPSPAMSPEHPETAAYVVTSHAESESESQESSEPQEPEFTLPGAAGLWDAIAALDAPVEPPDAAPIDALPHPLDQPYAEPAEQEALATPSQPPDREQEPVVAMVEEDGAILTTQPGGEPSLDAADALPTPPPAQRAPGRPIGEGGERGERVGAHSRAPSSEQDTPSGDIIAVMRRKVGAGDVAGAVGGMRAALTAAGQDDARLRALLPGLRALVDATPQHPDSRRLLGDAYTRLGLYAQAQGQYRQALLVRVAGKGAGRSTVSG